VRKLNKGRVGDVKVTGGASRRLLRPALALAVWLGCLMPSGAVTIRFEQAAYVAGPGDTLVLRTAFDQPVPHGLEAYYLKMTYHSLLFHLTPGDIAVPPELDFDLFTPGAVRTVLEGEARVRGFSEMGAPYTGVDFIEFTVTIPANAPAGTSTVTLAIADENSFIDGDGQVIDGDLVLEPSTITVQVPRPAAAEKPVFDPETGDLHGTYEDGYPGRQYRVEASADLAGWSVLLHAVADAGGVIRFTDPEAHLFNRRFYRVVDDPISP